MPTADPMSWRCGLREVPLSPPRVMGILNVTPDSFHDGGRVLGPPSTGSRPDPASVLAHARAMIDAGADILDVGGESTRPGATAVPVEEELARVLPAMEVLRAAAIEVPISIDTRRARVARAALAAGASIVNDVSGLADPEMAAVVAQAGAGLVIGHLRGDPSTMQREIRFTDLRSEIADELARSVQLAEAAGIPRAAIVVDPGIGFGKTPAQSAALLAASSWLREATGCAVLVGASRKSFLGALVGVPVAERLPGSLAAAVIAVQHGASIVRVHDVAETVQALAVARAVEQAWARYGHEEFPA